MTKKIFITPDACLKNGKLDFPLINLCKEIDFDTKRQGLNNSQLMNMILDMNCIRIFENKLKITKLSGQYNGQKVGLSGPIHLVTGEEAACVGQAYALSKEDYTFGSHRSHGEVIARSLVCIESMADNTLLKLMQDYMGGVIFEKVKLSVKTNLPVKQLARIFIYYGIISEIFGKETGFQKGFGGSMHVFFPPFGIYPSNAIVGASAPIAAGAALFKKINKSKSIAVANLGDGATGCGVVGEAMNFSAMKQFDTLWENRGALPVLFAFFNNGYGMGGQTVGETMAYDCLARIGAGISEKAMNAERVNGMDPLSVYWATKRIKDNIIAGNGPTILDMVVYRYEGHSQSDIEEYRTSSEILEWSKLDPLETYKQTLLTYDIITQQQIDELLEERELEVEFAFKMAVDDQVSPRRVFSRKSLEISRANFGSNIEEKLISNINQVASDRNEVASDIKKVASDINKVASDINKVDSDINKVASDINKVDSDIKKVASDINKVDSDINKVDSDINKVASDINKVDSDINKVARDRNKVASDYSNKDALSSAIKQAFDDYPELISYGVNARDWGGEASVYWQVGLNLPYERLFNTPVSEACMVSAAVGYAMCGGRAIVDLMFSGFIGRAGDELFNQLAKWKDISGGYFEMPVIIRVVTSRSYGAQHSQDWASLVSHIPGLCVLYPVTPYDVKGLFNAAIKSNNAVIFFENKELYGIKERYRNMPEEYFVCEIGVPILRRSGRDITVLSIGPALYDAMDAAEYLENEGIYVEVFDARSLVPFDYSLVISSVKKTGRLLVVGHENERASILTEFAYKISVESFENLKTAPSVLGAANNITPSLENYGDFLPDSKTIILRIKELISRGI